jgi:DNA repair protein RadD
MLRPYQQHVLNQLYEWFRAGNKGNPCIVMPTGSGKSHIIASLCKDALTQWPETRILMLTHVKELIEQNAEKMFLHWPDAPLGIYSSGLGIKTLGEPITFAGIQSLRKKSALIGHVDLIIVDECHLISHNAEGGYRALIDALRAINPRLRVIGLTATPWRLGHGTITEGDALFDDLLEPVSIEELVHGNFLAPLRSKHTDTTLSTKGIHKRGGEYIESELQAAVNTDPLNEAIVNEIISRAGDRKSWLLFCVGVSHARAIRDVLISKGVTASTILGVTPKAERERIIEAFKAGEITALTNANVLTTGFDYPDIDLLAMIRPTASPTLYVQMAGRGMRPKSHTDHCLVLDFAGVVRTHGPITRVEPSKKVGCGGSGEGEAPMKLCDECGEIVHISEKVCPACGAEFPPPPTVIKPTLHNDDIMGLDALEMEVTSWEWRKHISNASGKEMIKVTYYGCFSDKPITEYFPIYHGGYATTKAMATLRKMGIQDFESLDEMNALPPPEIVRYRMEGKYFRVVR